MTTASGSLVLRGSAVSSLDGVLMDQLVGSCGCRSPWAMLDLGEQEIFDFIGKREDAGPISVWGPSLAGTPRRHGVLAHVLGRQAEP